ncbi:DUF2829 domain-containing protein [Aliamphritea ceti]|uniref:DUF2829 domain-containing protein n=1 Tax=Aliamphritea ceti TaxID=1524258 RepID=UPI0021C39A1E|nr:DUF2829 domain-containing protein [Aliamphritea ceti]
MNYGAALELLDEGKQIQRQGWNGKGMFIFLVLEYEWSLFVFGWEKKWLNDNFEPLSFICMKTADDKLVPWLASQTDMLADDWQVCE